MFELFTRPDEVVLIFTLLLTFFMAGVGLCALIIREGFIALRDEGVIEAILAVLKAVVEVAFVAAACGGFFYLWATNP